MTITDLINQLERIRRTRGDLELRRYDYSDEATSVFEDIQEAKFSTVLFDPEVTKDPKDIEEAKRFPNGFVIID